MQLLTAANLRTKYDVSQHKNDFVINASISAIESTYLKPMLTPEFYAFLLESQNESPVSNFTSMILDGGLYDVSPNKKHINGLLDAIAALTFADLMIKQTVVTRFGAVNKNDQRSTALGYTELNTQISRYASVGKQYIDDVVDYVNTLDADDFTSEKNIIVLLQANECVNVCGILNEWI